MNNTSVYDELTLALNALNALEDLLSGGAHEVNPSGISLLLEPICARLNDVKEAMRKTHAGAIKHKEAANQGRVAA